MVDPTADWDDESDVPSCLHCDDDVSETGERRVLSSIEDDTVVLKHFCSPDCLESWTQ